MTEKPVPPLDTEEHTPTAKPADPPRVVDESAFDGGDDTDDDDDDDFGHLGMVVQQDDAPATSTAAVASAEPIVLEMAENPEIPLDLIDADALWVVKRLRMKGFEAYLTGGCVRDLLLGRKPKDFDVATAAHPNQVRNVFRNCRLIGRRFRLAHVFFPTGKVIETATFRASPVPVEDGEDTPADLLVERDNVFGNVEQDARRRDLTVNGLFYDPIGGVVIDYVEGRKDLEQKLIRTIGDPDIRFQEDPVRIMRAIKFVTRLSFDIDSATRDAMTKHAPALLRCAPARLQEEWLRLMTSGYAQDSFTLADRIGVLQAVMPELVEALNRPLAAPEPAAVAVPVVDASTATDAGEHNESAPDATPVATPVAAPEATPVVVPDADARWQHVSALMGAVDAVRARDVEVPPAVLLAAQLLPIAQAMHAAQQPFEPWFQETADKFTQRWRLTRYDRERILSILQSQHDLAPAKRTAQQARQTAGKPWFRDALLLFILDCQAKNLPLDEVNRWKVVAQAQGAAYQQQRALPHGARPPRDRPEGDRHGRGGRGGHRRGGGRDRGGDRRRRG
jgi:tRNA nucleotidyltransferase/poly(A) polymerase